MLNQWKEDKWRLLSLGGLTALFRNGLEHNCVIQKTVAGHEEQFMFDNELDKREARSVGKKDFADVVVLVRCVMELLWNGSNNSSIAYDIVLFAGKAGKVIHTKANQKVDFTVEVSG